MLATKMSVKRDVCEQDVGDNLSSTVRVCEGLTSVKNKMCYVLRVLDSPGYDTIMRPRLSRIS